jgi:sulfoquinovose isomerase
MTTSTAPHDPLTDPAHRRWLTEHREQLLDFYQPHVVDPSGGYSWLNDDGAPLPRHGHPLWLGARMLHVFSIASLLGRPGAFDVAQHGADFYRHGAGRDAAHGGWFSSVGGDEANDAKELYGLAHVLLAGSSARQAGVTGGDDLISEATELIDRHYWLEQDGLCLEAYDRAFTTLDPYRGQNANMHMTEACIAAFEATGESAYLERATRIARFIARPALGEAVGSRGPWRLAEHFDEAWKPLPDYNIDEPKHPFRPYGSLVGHWLEWAKLCLQLHGLGVDEDWLVPTAERLFEAAVSEGWQANGGFVYTVDWEGRPVVRDRYFWGPAEAVGAARYLAGATGKDEYLRWYETFWAFSREHFIDPGNGSWFHELDPQNRPMTMTWDGRPDLYHTYQATLYAFLPADRGLAAWAHDQHTIGHHA